MLKGLLGGAAAGAAGTTALNAVTYLDMAVRARGTSSAPEDVVETPAAKAGVPIPGNDDERANRLAGLGPLAGLAAGIGVGTTLGVACSLGFRPGPTVSALLAAVGAMAGANGPIAALGISDPRTWAAKDWAADVVPHLAYGAVTAAVLHGLDQQ